MIKTSYTEYSKTGYFSSIILDYLNNLDRLKPFYGDRPEKEALINAARNRKIDESKRQTLVNSLKEQYNHLDLSKPANSTVLANIEKLGLSNTVTVTTGHQLCLFTGPLYFIYKIFSTINLCEQLGKDLPDFNFVPVYWMASEDHDFEEINHFHLFGKELKWEQDATGAVGHLSTSSLKSISEHFEEILGDSEHANELKTWFEEAYLKEKNLADATRNLVNKLFSSYGLICLDGDDAALKSQFKGHLKNELLNQDAFKLISQTNEKLADQYKIQVNPREINLFLLHEGQRERIVADEKGDGFHLSESKTSFQQHVLLKLLEEHPEKFSPNVTMRPLYQEVILPNIAYIGGGGEIAYWMQLKSFFDFSEVPFPILMLRNSAIWVDKTSYKKLNKNETDITSIFKPLKDILGEYARNTSSVELNFQSEEAEITEWYNQLISKAQEVDQGMTGFLKAELQKSKNMLKDLEKKLVRSEKKNQENGINQLTAVKERLFPNGSLQERYTNFSELYLMYGDEFMSTIKANLNPLKAEFTILIDDGKQ